MGFVWVAISKRIIGDYEEDKTELKRYQYEKWKSTKQNYKNKKTPIIIIMKFTNLFFFNCIIFKNYNLSVNKWNN